MMSTAYAAPRHAQLCRFGLGHLPPVLEIVVGMKQQDDINGGIWIVVEEIHTNVGGK